MSHKLLKTPLPACVALALSMPAAAQLEEIVVTAQKREEGLQDTAIAVTAFTAGAIENKNIVDISELANFTPNLVFDTTSPVSGLSSGAVIFIRGIGNTDFSLTTDPGVGTYVDGVYLSRSAGGVFDVLDIERIEVLRGPQGTLFGRNTIGGAMSITSRKPGRELSGSLSATAGNFSRFDVRGSLDVPVSEKLLTSFVFSRKSADGYVDRVLAGGELGDQDRIAFRAKAVYEATDNLDFQLTYDYTKIDENSAASVILGFTPGASTIGYDLFRAAFAPDLPPVTDFLRNPEDDVSFTDGPTGTDLDLNGVSFSATYTADSWALKYIGGFRDTDGSFNRDPDNTPIAITHTFNPEYEHEQTSHELQLTGNIGDRLQYIAGAYFFEEDGTDNVFVPIFLPNVDDPANPFGFPAAVNNFATVDNSSDAFFLQGTYDITDTVSVTAGIRKTDDDKGFRYTQYIAADIDGNPLPVPLSAVDENGNLTPGLIPIVGNGSGNETISFDETTVRLGLDWAFQDNALVYYNYSEGFKSGGFVLRYVEARPAPLTFDPEFVESHEIGLKWQGFDDRVRVNTAIFSMDYQDAQVTFFDNLGGPITANAGSVDITGLELEVTALVTDNLLLELAYGYTDAEYQSIRPIGGLSLTIDETASLVNTPENSLQLGAEYSWLLSGGGDLTLRGDYIYTDDIFNDSQNSPFLFQDAYDMVNLALSYTASDERWSLTGFVKNATDERFITSGDSNFGLGFHEGNLNRPREYGLRLNYNFN
ncbi:MAG: TonB-dependent receptor [Lysobacterales bacterium]